MKYFICGIGFLLAGQQLFAQDMPMEHHVSSGTKNIFLAMMDTMMIKMNQVPTSETASASFILQMIPHHEGAIKMASYEIRHGKHFNMIQLAKSILAEQKNEVEQMRLWLKYPPQDTVKATPAFLHALAQAMNSMMKNMPTNHILTDTDDAFAAVMIPHHQAAIDMARVIVKYSRDQQTVSFAKHIISSQQVEIEQMSSFLKR